MPKEYEEVDQKTFRDFLERYPGDLDLDCTGICEPPLVGYYDFGRAEGLEALVAKYHKYDDPTKIIYKISRHLLD